VELHLTNMRARMPFRYGIATLTALPHLFVRVDADVDGQRATGHAADSLPPKWFTKDPDTQFVDDIAVMIAVIRQAADDAIAVGDAPTAFDLWHQVYRHQAQWGRDAAIPPLLSGFGVSLIERALIDAVCRSTGTPFADAIRSGRLGMNPRAIYPELGDIALADVLPGRPLASLSVRHTVGLGDPLYDEDIAASDRLHDGLPQSVESVIRDYGVTHFKVKLVGRPEADLERLRRLSRLLAEEVGPDFRLTLDGNENYRSVVDFQELWEAIVAEPALRALLDRLLFVEQPLHRDVALSSEVGDAMMGWAERPPIIIDESDGEADTLRQALDLGYGGTSHKNCKGVFKSVANACLLADRQKTTSQQLQLSAEDLTNVGPVALVQDMAVVATLGIPHVERNGHHYFTGLRHLPGAVQDAVLASHGDLFHRAAQGFATLSIQDGQISTKSVVAAPFGYDFAFDSRQFTPIDAWEPGSLDETLA
jgi:L-alanine-DL-glutamate epimerase-like enolase superfamily enzyme